jgi:hypothetical protein
MFVVDPVFNHIAAAAGAIVFYLSAFAKFRDLAAFGAAFAAYRIVPARVAAYVAPIVPCVEAALALGVLSVPARPFAALGLMGVAGLFAAALLLNLLRGNDTIDCGCSGFSGRQTAQAETREGGIGYGHVARAVALAALLWPATQPVAQRPMLLPDYATVCFAVLFITGAWYVADRLLVNAPKLKNLGV